MTVSRLQHASVPRPPGEEARARAVHFYQDVLGCEEIPKPRTFSQIDTTWFRCGDDEIHVLATDATQPLFHGGAHFCLVCDDLEGMRERLETAGFPCQDVTPIPGRPRFNTHDPFGNLIEITTIESDYLAT
jgi:catechol 2,3-dioxygenase-like lactoylglutathione lyase family enzyme